MPSGCDRDPRGCLKPFAVEPPLLREVRLTLWEFASKRWCGWKCPSRAGTLPQVCQMAVCCRSSRLLCPPGASAMLGAAHSRKGSSTIQGLIFCSK